MINKNTIKLIKSLALKKFRVKENMFLLEGDKLVLEALSSNLKINKLIVTPEFTTLNTAGSERAEEYIVTDHKAIKKVSLLQNPQNCIAICYIPDPTPLPTKLGENISIYLDGIQNPGNLGTIIRICDWYGIEYIFSSNDSVDFYNPKVIQATMGSFTRVKLWECSFDEAQAIARESGTHIYGAFMEGENIYNENLPKSAMLVVGNEGKGIRKQVENNIDKKISIPNFSTNAFQAESLNVSVATAIICSEFKRPKN